MDDLNTIRREDAKTCSSCTCWHKHCRAECCRELKFPLKHAGYRKGLLVYRLTRALSKDMVYYYKLRGIRYEHGLLKIDLSKFQIRNDKDGFITLLRDCDALDGMNCRLHGTEKKPVICRNFNELTGQMEGDSSVVGGYAGKNCLHNYRDDGTKTEN